MVALIFLKKAWLWFKKWSWVLLIAIAIVAFYWISKSYTSNLIDLMRGVFDRHDIEIEELNRINDEATKEKEQAQITHDRILKEIEEKYKISIADLDNKKKERIDELINEFKHDPDALTKRIAELEGFSIYESTN